jgi:hypothetical protein
MRGDDRRPDTMFSYVAPEQRFDAREEWTTWAQEE